MTFRKATAEDLPGITELFRLIIADLSERNINIWDDVYPFCVFSEDIAEGRFYLLCEETDIIGAFVLLESDDGESAVEWEKQGASALYLYRMGIRPDFYKKGLGSLMLKEAERLTKEKGREYLRLFVADCNEPAIEFYKRNGYKAAEGILDRGFDFLLLGYEIKV